MSVLYVSPAGQDSHEGTAKFPFRTLTHALTQASPGSIVQLAPGTYQSAEQFPLVVPPGVTVVGSQAQAVTIEGGRRYQLANAQAGERAPDQASRQTHVTLVLSDRAQIREVTITNPQGTGLLSHSGSALIVNTRLVRCQQHGVWIAGLAHPFLSNNTFVENKRAGLFMGDQAKGEVRQNRFERNDYGISLVDKSAPLLIGNQLDGNRCAILAADAVRPVLRQNLARSSREIGLWVKDRAQPEIGHPQDLGSNQFEGSTYDIRNDAGAPLATAGNRLNPVRVKGQITYLPSEIPDELAIPAVLLGNVEPIPFPSTPADSGDDPSVVLSLDSRFNDLVGHWSAPFVEVLAEKNLVKGFFDGTFQPDAQVTRAQFAALIAAAFPEADSVRAIKRFPDVPSNFWAAQAIRHAQSRGFISGFPDGAFRPNAPLPRVQAIVALVNGLGLGNGRSESLLIYGDRAQIPSYAIEPVAVATDRQIVVSYPDPYSLRPLEPITRAETTALVHQALAAADQTPRLLSPFIPEVDTAAPNFTDLSARHWARDFIDALVNQGWLSGFSDGSFRPDAAMTRAQFAALLVGAFDPSPMRPAVQFRDVPDDFWAAEVIQKAYRAGFLSGFPDLKFDPDFPLTKLQALLALVSGLDLLSTSSPEVRSLSIYSDKGIIPDYATRAIATATQLGLVFNHPIITELRPNRAATRGEVSAMVYQALVLANEMPAVASAYKVSLD